MGHRSNPNKLHVARRKNIGRENCNTTIIYRLGGVNYLSTSLYGCSGRNKRLRKGFSLVWLAFMWVIWKSRNEKIYNNVVGVVEDAVDLIQRLSWQWHLSKNAKAPCLLYE
ncbi:unnamed protein product [Trifolium pratense]|uniref:Uncharacterized protein n=1 Tax=Trifolium pratense TaxID=57577 RepID=A0ACB0J9P1_TRIPR|nr:unnamed protein product [Trifolium pratense]